MSNSNILLLGGIVTIPLVLFSILSMVLIGERLLFWWNINRRQRKMVQYVLQNYQKDQRMAIQVLKQNTDLPIARIFLAALLLNRPTPDEFRLALETAAQAELPLLKRFNTVFETIITVSPLLGLLGTILGLIRSFSSLQLGDIGGSNSAEVTGGIGEALVSTVIGLVVAIFTLLFANLFRSFYLRQSAFIQESGGQLELLYRQSVMGNR
ncbi:MotA/TolQ/ExbB proton channel family protein [Spirulina sp. CS-785/01]|uniref:MotA/TolQ/ExbB proton channel family protein n=1 Tax=Spirulina sp. CS-785/01 TaxID=3021716 RepID=UPI00232AF5BB|nr:MotA/TolQ/ExbB proton channel family protein [Spirulina sp. CS-785/01]MDB9314480.1 MotA/TolQ/ExbB proton channel family protein [Spirulina sp. CS-785/01]